MAPIKHSTRHWDFNPGVITFITDVCKPWSLVFLFNLQLWPGQRVQEETRLLANKQRDFRGWIAVWWGKLGTRRWCDFVACAHFNRCFCTCHRILYTDQYSYNITCEWNTLCTKEFPALWRVWSNANLCEGRAGVLLISFKRNSSDNSLIIRCSLISPISTFTFLYFISCMYDLFYLVELDYSPIS